MPLGHQAGPGPEGGDVGERLEGGGPVVGRQARGEEINGTPPVSGMSSTLSYFCFPI